MLERLIPTPKLADKKDGTVLVPFSLSTEFSPWNDVCETAEQIFFKIFRKRLSREAGGITLCADPSLKKGVYRIDTTEGCRLYASDREGILYAVASLFQIVMKSPQVPLEVVDGKMVVERCTVEDYPDKGYRGVMVDLAREWHPARTVHCYIDICFMLKLPYLHLHFIDDQRYTLPSRAFGRLCEGDSYSLEDVASFNAHAKACGVTLIPEFEAPGHAQMLNEAYPEVFANEIDGEGVEIRSEVGAVITDKNVICPGKERTMEALRTILTEICEMFPDSPYIHIGGDEANIKVWNHCRECRRYMEENGIADEKELYSDFVGRMARCVLELGRVPIVWEGFPKEGAHRVPKETVVIAWESYYHLAPDLLKAGFTVINCSWKPLYIVPSLLRRWDYRDILDWSVYRWTHFWVNSAATLNPITVAPTDKVRGAQYAVWECTWEQEINRVMENLPAFSERIWTVERVRDDETFRKMIPQIARMLAWLIREE
ncbi:MAG: family 20 glycosylhydrolase [Clostridia bacterium]|nr:family 20 glycosylhydrolase [Clostridia bacterium]